MWLALGLVLVLCACSSTRAGWVRLEDYQGLAASTTLIVNGVHGACDVVLAPIVNESKSEVRIRVPLREKDQDCNRIGLRTRIDVILKEPLGDRVVVDVQQRRALQQVP